MGKMPARLRYTIIKKAKGGAATVMKAWSKDALILRTTCTCHDKKSREKQLINSPSIRHAQWPQRIYQARGNNGTAKYNN